MHIAQAFLLLLFAPTVLADSLYVPAVNVAPCTSQCSKYQTSLQSCPVVNYTCVCSSAQKTFPGAVLSPSEHKLTIVY